MFRKIQGLSHLERILWVQLVDDNHNIHDRPVGTTGGNAHQRTKVRERYKKTAFNQHAAP